MPCFTFIDDISSCLQRLNNQHLPAVSWNCFALDQIIACVSQSLAKEQLLESLVRQLLEMLEMAIDTESAYLIKVDVETRLQHIMFAHSNQKIHIPENFTVSWNYLLCRRVIDEDCLFSDEVPDRRGNCIAAHSLGIITLLGIPIHLSDGSLYGTLYAASSEEHQWNERVEQVLQLFTGPTAQYTQKEALVEQLHEASAALIAQSYTDSLTGLPDRRVVFENLTTPLPPARHLSHKIMVASIDLDSFKLIDDYFGHNSGDPSLIQAGERLNTLQQNGEVTGRPGGDESLVVSLNNESVDILSL